MKYFKLKNIQIGGNNPEIINKCSLGFDINRANNICSVESSFNKFDLETLHCLVKNYFEKDFLSKITNFTRPLSKSYGDVVERKLGRFELIPPKHIYNQVLSILSRSNTFNLYNQLAKNEIKRLNGEDVVEEMCLLPVEPGVADGEYHRDIFVKSSSDFSNKPFYITHLIYLDNISSTEFCLGSQNNPDNNPDLYSKLIVQAEYGKMALFDGRIIHKGLGNKSKTTRYAIYIAYYKKSYIDEESILPYLLQ